MLVFPLHWHLISCYINIYSCLYFQPKKFKLVIGVTSKIFLHSTSISEDYISFFTVISPIINHSFRSRLLCLHYGDDYC